jgi:hypothetical protein
VASAPLRADWTPLSHHVKTVRVSLLESSAFMRLVVIGYDRTTFITSNRLLKWFANPVAEPETGPVSRLPRPRVHMSRDSFIHRQPNVRIQIDAELRNMIWYESRESPSCGVLQTKAAGVKRFFLPLDSCQTLTLVHDCCRSAYPSIISRTTSCFFAPCEH